MTKTVKCHRCTMSFVVGKPKSMTYVNGKGRWQAETVRCPDCKRPFWHAEQTYTQRIRTGILPKHLPEWQA